MATLAASPTTDDLAKRYLQVRKFTEYLCEPLATEDYVAQSMADVSPTKWHIAHVTWFFETFVLARRNGFEPHNPHFQYLFNSYYNAVGEQYARADRGVLTRPTVAAVVAWRQLVDIQMQDMLARGVDPATAKLIELGLNHEQQHQELLLMDIKHVFSCNPMFPSYRRPALSLADAAPAMAWTGFDGGDVTIGAIERGFAFDNERPRHRCALPSFELANRLVTNAEYQAFIDDGGYQQPALWLADGWATTNDRQWRAPQYWVNRDDEWHEFTLYGLQPLDPNRPVCHLSYYEADAFATWSGARLPTEVEWEHASATRSAEGELLNRNTTLHPGVAGAGELSQLLGDCWEWTRSPYQPYPGYQAPKGAVGEYNGKFMVNQMVMRGGACVTPDDHIRSTYRNFFYPHMRWQFGGVRLAR